MARNNDYDAAASETIIGASVKVEGDLVSEGDIRVNGVVTGKVKTEKNLYIGPKARIEADVEAENVELAGSITGEVKIRGLLNILNGGTLKGDISCNRLSIAEGASFTGSCSMPEVDEPQSEEAEDVAEEEE
jgi:cytoskeletal protein CcmA (bactofilin family)